MSESPDAPIFAGRYRFEPVGKGWDRGRTGYTHLVYDLRARRLGVIKRAEIISKQATERLKNEVRALRALRERGVPEVYDIGQASYGSKNYFYIVIEYIDEIRIEREIHSLSVYERVKILTQLFRLLVEAHRRGIVNGDIDLKHLFWRRDKKQLIVIDWGNARLGVDPEQKAEFAYDLARSAEIIFALVTRHQPPSTGSIALPNDSLLEPGMPPAPHEFHELCQWAPRILSEGVIAPYTAIELLEASQKWLATTKSLELNKSPGTKRLELKESFDSKPRWPYLAGAFALIVVLAALVALFIIPKRPFFPSATASPTYTETPLIAPSIPLLTEPSPSAATLTQPSVNSTEIPASTPAVIPPPLAYSNPSIYFDNKVTFSLPSSPPRSCWRESNSPSNLPGAEGFYRRSDLDWWLFGVAEGRSIEQPVEVDFSPCLVQKTIGAMALNSLVTRLEPEKVSEPAREFGVFVVGQNGRREYTLWIDQENRMHLRIRENGVISYDELVQAVSLANLQTDGIFPNIYNKFPVQIFLEIDNQGFDILYLQDAPHDFVKDSDLKPVQRIDEAVRTTIGKIQKIGLVGYGGKTHVLIWPLVFLEK